MQNAKEKRKKEAAKGRKRAVRLLTMGQNRSFLNLQGRLTLIQGRERSSYKLGLKSFSIKRVETFSFSMQ